MTGSTDTAPQIRADRLKYFQSRFRGQSVEGSESEIVLDLLFEELWGKFGRLASMETASIPSEMEPSHASVLARAGAFVSSRLSDAIARWFSVRWLHQELGAGSGVASERWKRFARLSIKDAHTDIVSLMDSLAFFVINVQEDRHLNAAEWAPAFGQLRSSKGKWRNGLAPTMRQWIDQTDDWFTFVKRIRDAMVHRRHTTLIFGPPVDLLGFQVYLKADVPEITAEPLLIRPAGGPIVDFSLYGVWMLAEAIFFMDRVAMAAMGLFGIEEGDMPGGGGRVGGGEQLRSETTRLLGQLQHPGESVYPSESQQSITD